MHAQIRASGGIGTGGAAPAPGTVGECLTALAPSPVAVTGAVPVPLEQKGVVGSAPEGAIRFLGRRAQGSSRAETQSQPLSRSKA